MLKSICHCGAVVLEVPHKPRRLTRCNCSLCHRLGTLWAYYDLAKVKTVKGANHLDTYVWGEKTLTIHRCKTCGGIMQWTPIGAGTRTGVNARNMGREITEHVRIRTLDGADTWKFLD